MRRAASFAARANREADGRCLYMSPHHGAALIDMAKVISIGVF